MISNVQQVVLLGLITAFFINETAGRDQTCTGYPEYRQNLINEVSPFYTLTSGPLHHLRPNRACSQAHVNQIAKPRWPVYTLEPGHADMSTCPWGVHFDEDDSRFPCRIETARLLWRSFDNRSDPVDHRTRCLRNSGSRYERFEGRYCKHLVQDVPVVARTGCTNGVSNYAIRNITITVGFTCIFG